MEKDAVAALASDQSLGVDRGQPPGRLAVIGDIDALQGRSQTLAERREVVRRQGGHGLAHHGEIEAARLRRRLRIGPFVAFAVLAEIGHEGRL